jgi:hypothetical protein
MVNSRRKFLTSLALAVAGVCLPRAELAIAADNKKHFSVDGDRLAIQGYDTVSYFADGKPAKGSAEFETEWQGARWRFASAAHRDLFTQRPDAYAPRFGGFCAGAIADNIFARPDPEAWIIVDGKLYLNGSKSGLVDWKQNTAANIAAAQKRWDAMAE